MGRDECVIRLLNVLHFREADPLYASVLFRNAVDYVAGRKSFGDMKKTVMGIIDDWIAVYEGANNGLGMEIARAIREALEKAGTPEEYCVEIRKRFRKIAEKMDVEKYCGEIMSSPEQRMTLEGYFCETIGYRGV